MYSQFNEEEIILNFFGDRRGSFLDIGAWDGLEISNTRRLAELGWSGVLVEPCPSAFIRLLENNAANKKTVCVNAAIAPSRQIRTFFGQSEWGGTLNPNYINYGTRRFGGAYYVLTMSPADLAEIGDRLGMRYEFVSLDAEWMDADILAESKSLLTNTELLCVEVTDDLFKPQDPIPTACRELGFTKEIGRTHCNLIVAR